MGPGWGDGFPSGQSESRSHLRLVLLSSAMGSAEFTFMVLFSSAFKTLMEQSFATLSHQQLGECLEGGDNIPSLG